jgi:hypothetical protein
MARSLKERYETRRLQQLHERVKGADEQMLLEHRTAQLIIEAMDQEDLDKVTAIVQKLETIKSAAGDDLKTLSAGIEQAQAELNKFTAGGPIAKAWTKLKGKIGIDNPIVKITTFASALEKGFKQLPAILKNNGISTDDLKGDDPNQLTLRDAIVKQFIKKPDATADALKKTAYKKEEAGTGQDKGILNTPPDTKGVEASGKADANPKAQAKIKSVIAQLQKALSPGGIFGAFKKVPYVDSAALAQELTNAHVATLVAVSKAVTQGAQSAEVASGLKDQVAGGGGDVGTAGTAKTAGATPAGQTQPGEPAKSTTGGTSSAPTGEKPAAGPGEKPGGGEKPAAESSVSSERIKKIANHVAQASNVDVNTVIKVLSALNDIKKLREVKRR